MNVKKLKKRKSSVLSSSLLVLSSLLIVITFLALLLVESNEVRVICAFLLACYLVVTYILLFFRFEKNGRMEQLLKNDAFDQTIQDVEQYCSKIQVENDKTRKKYHDLSSHLLVVKELEKSGKTLEAKQYKEEVLKDYEI